MYHIIWFLFIFDRLPEMTGENTEQREEYLTRTDRKSIADKGNLKVVRTLTFKSLSGKKLSLPQLWSWKPRFTFWNYPQLNFFKLSFMFFFLSKSSFQHMSLNFLMGSAETGNKTSASKLQVGSKHSHNVFQIIKLEAKVPDHFHISFRVFWLLCNLIRRSLHGNALIEA